MDDTDYIKVGVVLNPKGPALPRGPPADIDRSRALVALEFRTLLCRRTDITLNVARLRIEAAKCVCSSERLEAATATETTRNEGESAETESAPGTRGRRTGRAG